MDISIKCDSLKAIYSVKNGMLRCAAPYEFTISVMPMIKVCIEEVGNRIITFTCKEEIEAKNYSFSAGQYFEVKLDYVDITSEEFQNKMNDFETRLQELFTEGNALDEEIMTQLKRLKFND